MKESRIHWFEVEHPIKEAKKNRSLREKNKIVQISTNTHVLTTQIPYMLMLCHICFTSLRHTTILLSILIHCNLLACFTLGILLWWLWFLFPLDVFPLRAFLDFGIKCMSRSLRVYISNFDFLNSTLRLNVSLHWHHKLGMAQTDYLPFLPNYHLLTVPTIFVNDIFLFQSPTSHSHLCCVANQLTNLDDSRRFIQSLLWFLPSLQVT